MVLAGAKKPRRATGGPNELYCVKSTQEISLDKFGLSGKVTRLEFEEPNHALDAFDRRTSWVVAQSEELDLAERPLYYPLLWRHDAFELTATAARARPENRTRRQTSAGHGACRSQDPEVR